MINDSIYTRLVNGTSEGENLIFNLIDCIDRHIQTLFAQEYLKCYKNLLTK